MGGEFTEVRGTAHDLQAWHELLTGDAAPFQRIEAAREAGAFTGRFWRVVLDQVTANLIEITASEHTISRTAEHIKAQLEPYYLVLFQVRGRPACCKYYRSVSEATDQVSRPSDVMCEAF